MQKLIKNILKMLFVITFLHKGFCSQSQQKDKTIKSLFLEKIKNNFNVDKTLLLSTLISGALGYYVNRNNSKKYNFAFCYAFMGMLGLTVGKEAKYQNKKCSNNAIYKEKENFFTRHKNKFILTNLSLISYLFYKNKNNISHNLIDHKDFYLMTINLAVTYFIGKQDGSSEIKKQN